MQKGIYAFLLVSLFSSPALTQSGCPGCAVQLPELPVDTVYIGPAPDGVAGQHYDGDISFRMPKTTTPVNAVDPSTPAGLAISKIKIVSVVNIPPGLSWEANKTEFDLSNETDGCVKFCGTPLQPGLYEVQVFVVAEVLLINQSTSFSFPIYIAPAVSSNDGFSMENNSGCGEVTVSFQNNVPSQADPGYSYHWDFGNGQTSTLENPSPKTFDSAGVYEVNYKARIDTFGYQLTTIRILEASCGDFSIPPIINGNPDLYIKIKDPTGSFALITSPVDNAPIPFAFTVNLPILPGNYSLEVRDDDTFGSDLCGTVNFNQNTAGPLQSGNLKVAMDIIHPVFEVSSVDTVIVYAVPEPPVVTPGGPGQICSNDAIELNSDYLENIQWYRDTSVLFGETGPSLVTSQAGNYWVEYTSDDGCKSQSEPTNIEVLERPAPPAFHNDRNFMKLNDPGLLPDDYTLEWLIDGNPITEELRTSLCTTESGTHLYTLRVTDNNTGCSNEFSLGVNFDPAFDCTVATEELTALKNSLEVFPNPTSGWLNIKFGPAGHFDFDVAILDATGRTVLFKNEQQSSGSFSASYDLKDLAAGLYLLQIRTADGTFGERIVKQ